MKDYQKTFTRRDVIKIGLVGTAAPLLISISGQMQAADASKTPISVVQYRDKPNGKQQCSNCIQFIPNKTPDDHGGCKVVAGKVSPQGWCSAYVPES